MREHFGDKSVKKVQNENLLNYANKIDSTVTEALLTADIIPNILDSKSKDIQ